MQLGDDELGDGRWVEVGLGKNSCTMDPAVIAREGGSLVVEARDDQASAPRHRVQWAGPHSAKGAGDCAGSADIAVSRIDLQKLANAGVGLGSNMGWCVRA